MKQSVTPCNASLPPDDAPAGEGYPSALRGWLTVALLVLFYIVAMMDRKILSLLIEPMKADLDLTDVQVSLLYGAAFGITYSVGALPLGAAVDRFSRRTIIFGGAVFWSLASAACGLTHSFAGLFAARSGVGLGEAAMVPASHSILADSFPPDRLSMPMSVYGTGAKIGSGVSLTIGSALILAFPPMADFSLPLLGELRGWQLIFIAAGLPGVAIAMLIFLIPEPPRIRVTAPMSYFDYARLFWTNRRLMISVHLALLLMIAMSTAMLAWTVPILVRVYGWSISDAGFVLGPILTLVPLAAVPVHGWLVDRAYRNGIMDAHLRHMTWMAIASLPCASFAFFMPSPWVALAMVTFVVVLTASFLGITSTVIQLVVPSGLRGKAASVSLLIGAMLGTSLGSTAPALISDELFGKPSMIGPSVSIFTSIALFLATIAYGVGRKGMRDHVTAKAG